MGRPADSLNSHTANGTFRHDRHAHRGPQAEFGGTIGPNPFEGTTHPEAHQQWEDMLLSLPDQCKRAAFRSVWEAACRHWQDYLRADNAAKDFSREGNWEGFGNLQKLSFRAFKAWESLNKSLASTPIESQRLERPKEPDESDEFDQAYGGEEAA